MRARAILLLALSCGFLTSAGWAERASGGRPRITDLEVVPAEPRLGDSIELRFRLEGFDGNPYDPHEIRIDARWRRPDGTVSRQPAFLYQPFRLEGRTPQSDGPAGWRVRFTPRLAGRHEIVVDGHGASGSPRDARVELEVGPGSPPLFVGVSSKNPRYLARSDGSPFWGIGMNVGWWQVEARALESYAGFFREIAAAGGNLVRLWMTNSGTRVDWILSIQDRALGAEFNQQEAWLFDRIVEQAERRGIRLIVTLDDVNELGRNWKDNLYSREQGGPLERPSQYFTHRGAQRYQRAALRYVIGRWGYSPSIVAWELFNEIDLLRYADPTLEYKKLLRWHRSTARYLHEIDSHRHLVSTSTGSFRIHPELYGRRGGLDTASMHLYDFEGRHGDTRDMARLTHEVTRLLLDSVAEKPAIVGEVGLLDAAYRPRPALGGGPGQPRDRDGVFLHNALWTGVMSGLAVAPLAWHWLEHEELGDAWWSRYRALSVFLSRIDSVGLAPMPAVNFEPVPGLSSPGPPPRGSLTASDARLRVLGLRDGDRRVYLWIQNRDHTWGNVVDGERPAPAQGTVAVDGLAPGTAYTVRWWDPWKLEWAREVDVAPNGAGRLELAVENLIRDRAVAIEAPAPPTSPTPPTSVPRAETSPRGTGLRTKD